jgi:hypothetical protein
LRNGNGGGTAVQQAREAVQVQVGWLGGPGGICSLLLSRRELLWGARARHGCTGGRESWERGRKGERDPKAHTAGEVSDSTLIGNCFLLKCNLRDNKQRLRMKKVQQGFAIRPCSWVVGLPQLSSPPLAMLNMRRSTPCAGPIALGLLPACSEAGLEFIGDLRGHTQRITGARFDIPEEPHLLHTSSADGTVRGWDTRSGQQVEG